MKCNFSAELLSAYLDGELNEKDKQKVKEHLKGCASCRKELEELRRFDEYVRDMEIEEPSREFVFTLNRKILERISKKRRFSFFKLSPLLAPVAVAALAFIIINNMVQRPHHLINLDHRIVYPGGGGVETETQGRAEVSEAPESRSSPEEKYARGAGFAKKEVESSVKPKAARVIESSETEEVSDRITAVRSAEEEMPAASVPSLDELEIPEGRIVRAIVDTNGNIVKVATGNKIVPERDTLLERRLKGQQIAPPTVAGKRKQLYMDLTRQKESEE
ncbi:MAG TPA: hypothetical protein ENI34_09045 [candidate division WOR-3 bacterium]|uniref:Putative zinc-finger domain-containing protein n=1 Tax=candidate division WOR-3 bacterium TaxID=2052148 RepID=A0A9C9EPS4_UNCW3|nr:hypothetical protein [candidate division WOR-3 bacterium]